MKQIGYTVGTIFVRSYEQGERVYTSMLCRGYGRDSFLFVEKKPLKGSEWAVLSFSLLFIVAVPLAVWLTAVRLF
jgi:cobalt/nickel transport system permease protein